jgi:hypothetical protein
MYIFFRRKKNKTDNVHGTFFFFAEYSEIISEGNKTLKTEESVYALFVINGTVTTPLIQGQGLTRPK